MEGSSPLILDGGLATELETRGHDLSDELWSARLLIDQPEAIRELHYDYLVAGADCIISASYQGSIAGFMNRGLSYEQAVELLKLSVDLAVQARDEFWANPSHRAERIKPLVAASVGPYGAVLADGSEFTGDYNLDKEGLREFHRERLEILAATPADILACETIPSLVEADVLGTLLAEHRDRPGWISFSCRDGAHINDGTVFSKAVKVVDAVENVRAIGINCTAPEYLPSLIAEASKVTGKPIIVYPNSGERYDAVLRRWTGRVSTVDYAVESQCWQAAGASIIGGCCRTGPEHIRSVRQSLVG